MPKKGDKKTWSGFAVAGTKYANEGMRITRIEWIAKYVRYGAKFCLVRDPENTFDPNAIKVKHVLKSGKKMTIGYVPNNSKRPLADEFAPLMDKFNWHPKVALGQKLVAEEDNPERGLKAGEVYGLTLRYAIR